MGLQRGKLQTVEVKQRPQRKQGKGSDQGLELDSNNSAVDKCNNSTMDKSNNSAVDKCNNAAVDKCNNAVVKCWHEVWGGVA